VAASAVSGVAAARTAAAKIHAKARMRLKSAKRAIGRAEIIFFVPASATTLMASGVCQRRGFDGSSLPIRPGSAISPNFIARLIKGCRGDVTAGLFRLWNSQAFSTL
jgi:hypothetical protein